MNFITPFSDAGKEKNKHIVFRESDILPVSYTHLDVSIKYTMLYKRKANKKMGFHLFI